MELTVQSLEHFGEVCVLRLVSPHNLPIHQPGHYAVLQFGNFSPRPYSIANAPNGQYLEFHIKNGGHAGGSTFATHNLKVGDSVTFHQLGGNYTLVPTCIRPLFLVAGGTGLAPMLAISEASLLDNPARPVHLFYGGRTASDLYYDAHLTNIAEKHSNFFYTPALSEENHQKIQFGLIGKIALNHPDILKSRLYIAGPVDMVRNIISAALAKGVSPDVIHSDYKELHKTND